DYFCQRLFVGLVNDTQRVDVTRVDADQPGDMTEIVEPAHPGTGSRKNAALTGAIDDDGAAALAYRRWPAGGCSSDTGCAPKFASSSSRAPSPSRHSPRIAAGPSSRHSPPGAMPASRGTISRCRISIRRR